MKKPEKNNIASTIIEADGSWNYAEPTTMISFDRSVPEDIAASIFASIRRDGHIAVPKGTRLHALSEVKDPAGHFFLNAGKEKWFLRVSRRQRKDPILEDKMSAFAVAHGVRVPVPEVTGLTVSWQEREYLLYIFPFIAGRHYNGSLEDLAKVSKALKRMHNVLKKSPFEDDVKAAALKTAQRLEKATNVLKKVLNKKDFSVFAELAGWIEINHDWLKRMTENFDPYLCHWPSAQCVHGDFHVGNVMFAEDGEVITTDLEETPDSWLPLSFDIAYLVQRFGLYGQPSSDELKKRLEVIRATYGPWPAEQKEMFSQVCWYLIALIFDRCLRRESIVPFEECDKFVNLERASKDLTL